jgi:PQQ-like domain
LIAIDAATLQESWRTEVDPGGDAARDDSRTLVTALGVVGNEFIFVITYGQGVAMYETVAFDVTARRLACQRDDFQATTVTKDGVIGDGRDTRTGGRSVVKLAASDGSQLWSVGNVTTAGVNQRNPALVAVTTPQTLGQPVLTFELLDNATGAVKYRLDAETISATCFFDGDVTILCHRYASGAHMGDGWLLAAFDRDGTLLWSLPDTTNRLMPAITVAWLGVAYGCTKNGPIVLDARTGADRETRPGMPAAYTNAYVGLGWPKCDDVSTSMTINAPASVLLLLNQLVAEEHGVPAKAINGRSRTTSSRNTLLRVDTSIFQTIPAPGWEAAARAVPIPHRTDHRPRHIVTASRSVRWA